MATSEGSESGRRLNPNPFGNPFDKLRANGLGSMCAMGLYWFRGSVEVTHADAIERELAAERWDAEYRDGRYAGQPPVPFVDRILATLGTSPLRSSTGLYVGCGNGRNFLPLVDAGLRLYGLDLSTESLHQLAARNPAVSERLIRADFRTWQSRRRFGYVIAIQVFQHGDAADVAGYFAKVASILDPGGLLFLRVNSTSTQIFHSHTIIEQNELGGMTVRYEAGPKRGLPVHFFTRDELLKLTADAFDVVDTPCEDITRRSPPETGSWVQWEGIWQRRGG